jgi:hypothetical protein
MKKNLKIKKRNYYFIYFIISLFYFFILKFNKINKSLSVFSSEASLREEVIRENLGEKVGINPSRNKPLLWDLLFSNDSKLMENENESGVHKKP